MGCRICVVLLMVLIATSCNSQTNKPKISCTRASLLGQAFHGSGSTSDMLDPKVKIGTDCEPTKDDEITAPDTCQLASTSFMKFGDDAVLITPLELALKCGKDSKCGCADEGSTPMDNNSRCLKQGLKGDMECIHHKECDKGLLCLPNVNATCRTCKSSARKLQISSTVLLLWFISVVAVFTAYGDG